MKVVILAGGLGSRLHEETTVKPKPMVEIGEQPILWHIMSIYAAYGYREFLIALGYRGELIKNYFLNYYHLRNNLSIDLSSGKIDVQDGDRDDWLIHLIDTGLRTQTGGRLRRLASNGALWGPHSAIYPEGAEMATERARISYSQAPVERSPS